MDFPISRPAAPAPPAATLSEPGTLTWDAGAPAGPGDGAPPGYELIEVVGRGGMGVVWRARESAMRREVAVKLLLEGFAPDSVSAARFVEEARITGQLQHPGIPAVYRVGATADGRPFLAMKLIRGRTLGELLRAGEPIDALAVFEAVCQAVGYAHANGVVHRDLKPANVMVGGFGEVQVMDWGLAKLLTDPDDPAGFEPVRDADADFTQAGMVLGTPAYMPPEQAAGRGDQVTERSDVFGLGAILCALLTGKPPFAGPDALSTLRSAAQGETGEALARLAACGAEPAVVALCRRCLALDPAGRFADGAAVAAAVAELRRAAEARARRAEAERVGAAARRRLRARAVGALAAVLLLGIAGTTWGLIQAEGKRREAELAQAEESRQRAEAEAGRAEAERQRVAAEASEGRAKEREADAEATFWFFTQSILFAARPAGQGGGLGVDVTVRRAIEAALPKIEPQLGHRPLIEARVRLTLARSFQMLGDFRAAEQQDRRAYDLCRERLGPDHDLTLEVMHHLATVYRDLRRFADALPLDEECLRRRTAAFGPDHAQTIWAMEGLAITYRGVGRSPEALAVTEECLRRRVAANGPDDPATLSTMHGLIVIYRNLNRAGDAVRVGEECLRRQRATIGSDDGATLWTMQDLAVANREAGRFAEALELHEECTRRRTALLGRDNPLTIWVLSGVADDLLDLGRNAEAVQVEEECVRRRKATLGPNDNATLYSMCRLADAYRAVGRAAESLELDEDCLRRRSAKPWARRDDTLRTLTGLVADYHALGRPLEALPALEAAWREVRARPVPDDRFARSITHLRADLFRAARDPAGCRATAELWEGFGQTDRFGLFHAGRLRAITAAALLDAGPPADGGAEARAEADKAMAWVTKAAAAGYADAERMRASADFDALRGRADFRKLVAEMGAKPR